MYYAWFDGSSSPSHNQGKMGGVVISPKSEVVLKYSTRTNYMESVFVEYDSLIYLLEKISKLRLEEVTIFGDCKIVIEHVNGWTLIDKRKFNKRGRMARKFINNIPKCTIRWVPRERNEIANHLCHDKNIKGFLKNSFILK